MQLLYLLYANSLPETTDSSGKIYPHYQVILIAGCGTMRHQILNQILSGILIISLIQMGCYNLRHIPEKYDPVTVQYDTKIFGQILKDNIGERVRIDLKNGDSITGRLISYEKPKYPLVYFPI